MIASELIEILEKRIKMDGDMPVKVCVGGPQYDIDLVTLYGQFYNECTIKENHVIYLSSGINEIMDDLNLQRRVG